MLFPLSMVLPILVAVLQVSATASFRQHQTRSRHYHRRVGDYGARETASTIRWATSCSKGPRRKMYFPLFSDDGNSMSNLEATFLPKQVQQQSVFTFLMAACFFCSIPQLANAKVAPPVDLIGTTQKSSVAYGEQLMPTVSSSSSSSSTPSLFLATYASEGSGGLPFLSPFQTPGAAPKPTADDDKDARNRAFDEAFDQDKRERDAYYAKMALAAREKKMMELNTRRAEIGLDSMDSGPRVGDEKVASMASLKQYLLQKDPSTMTSAEFKEFQLLQQRHEVQP